MRRPAWMTRALRQNKDKAEKYLNDPGKLRRLVDDVQARAKQVEASDSPIAGAVGFLALTTRLISAYARGEYRVVPWGVMVGIVSALLYFLMPADLVPDVLVGIGLLDDAAILAFVASQVKTDLDRFALWEHDRQFTVDSTATPATAAAATPMVPLAVDDVYLDSTPPAASTPPTASTTEQTGAPPDADQVDGARAWQSRTNAKS